MQAHVSMPRYAASWLPLSTPAMRPPTSASNTLAPLKASALLRKRGDNSKTSPLRGMRSNLPATHAPAQA
jgi:hypothetical protein